MANKCICLARVSTQKQDLEQHRKVLAEEASRMGYSSTNIIYIGEKESGKTLEEEERITLQTMWDYLNKDNSINCVIVTEVSRIARKPKICFSVRDQLQARHVQLVILKPYCVCFDKDWRLDEAAGITFAIFSQFSENEANHFKERSKRGKAKCAENGKYTGGPVKYGYKVEPNGKLVVDPETSANVRLVFQLRIEKQFSATQIFYELQERGIVVSHGKIKKMLYDSAYTGAKVIGQGKGCVNERALPPIITEEEFKKAQAVTELNKVTRTKKKHNWLLIKLFYCGECGNLLVPATQNHKYFYACAVHKNRTKYMIKKCSNSCQVWTDVIEALVWSIAKRCYKFDVLQDNNKSIQSLSKENTILLTKISVLEQQLGKSQKAIERAKKLYVDGDYTDEEWKSEKKKRSADIAEANSKIEQYKLVISRNTERIEQMQNADISISEATKMLDSIDELDDRIQKQDLVHRYISKITLEYFNEQHDKLVKIYEIGYGETIEEFVIQNRSNKIFCHAMTVQGVRDDFGLAKIQAKAKELGIELGDEDKFGIPFEKSEYQNGKIFDIHQNMYKELEKIANETNQ